MNSNFTPDNRRLIAEDIAGNKYIATKLQVSEKLCELFTVRATVFTSGSFDEHSFINKPLTISYRSGFETQLTTRFIVNGYVKELCKYSRERGDTLWR